MQILFSENDIRLLRTAVEYSLQFGSLQYGLSLETHELWKGMEDLLRRLKALEQAPISLTDGKKIIV
jgi:hypothetical protein